jgi:LysM repeat protein
MMKNFFLFAFVFIASTHFSFAQTGDLILKSSDKGLYLDHKVTAKENFYSIGRLYNAPPKEIAAYNGLDMSKGLSLGQMIRIPLTPVNFSQTVNEGTPVYYKVGVKESLMKVSNANNKVSLENLRRWNNLTGDNVSTGNKLIVGFIVAGQMPVVAKQEPEKIKTEKEQVVEKKEPEKVKEEKEPVAEKKMAEKNEDKEKKLASPKAELNTVVINNETKGNIADEQGYFKSFFDQQVKVSPISKSATVTAGIFKTASGWKDAKYYLLIDGVQPGTIMKIINPANNKTVYAKVLGEMSSIRLNAGLDIRISNSAATALEINETDKFIVKVNY